MERIKIHTIKYNILMNIILKVSVCIFPMITFPYVSRVLLATGNGKIAFATSVVNYFTLLAALGIPTYGVKACAQVRDDRERLSKTVQELLAINLISTVISYMLFAFLMFTVKEFKENNILLWITSISIILNVCGVEWFYQAIEQYDYITFRNIMFKVISLVLMFALIHEPQDYIIYGGITVLGTVGSNILNIIRISRYVELKHFGHLELKKHLMPVFMLFMYSAATTIYTNLDIVMLGFISGDAAVGYYNAAIKIKGIIVSIITAIGTVLVPRISYYLNNGKYNEFISLIKKSFSFVLLLSIPLNIFFVVNAKNTIDLLAGAGYQPAVLVLKVVMVTIVFIGIGSVTAWQILIPMGKEKYTVIGAMVGGSVDLILNSLLIPTYGALGAAIGTLAAEIAVIIIHVIAVRDILKDILEWTEIIKCMIGGFIGWLFLINIKDIMFPENIFLNLFINFTGFFIVYILSMIVLKEKLIFEYIIKVKKQGDV